MNNTPGYRLPQEDEQNYQIEWSYQVSLVENLPEHGEEQELYSRSGHLLDQKIACNIDVHVNVCVTIL